jgi:hypothetical protein
MRCFTYASTLPYAFWISMVVAKSLFSRKLDQFDGAYLRHVFLFLVVKKSRNRPDALARPCAEPNLKASLPIAHGSSLLAVKQCYPFRCDKQPDAPR